jgi:hypothetical protein
VRATTPQVRQQAPVFASAPDLPLAMPTAAFTPIAPAATTGSRHAQPAAPPAGDVAPPAPLGGIGSGIASATGGAGAPAGVALAILVFLMLAPCLRYGRVRLAPAHWRPVTFVSLLERPG